MPEMLVEVEVGMGGDIPGPCMVDVLWNLRSRAFIGR